MVVCLFAVLSEDFFVAEFSILFACVMMTFVVSVFVSRLLKTGFLFLTMHQSDRYLLVIFLNPLTKNPAFDIKIHNIVTKCYYYSLTKPLRSV